MNQTQTLDPTATANAITARIRHVHGPQYTALALSSGGWGIYRSEGWGTPVDYVVGTSLGGTLLSARTKWGWIR